MLAQLRNQAVIQTQRALLIMSELRLHDWRLHSEELLEQYFVLVLLNHELLQAFALINQLMNQVAVLTLHLFRDLLRLLLQELRRLLKDDVPHILELHIVGSLFLLDYDSEGPVSITCLTAWCPLAAPATGARSVRVA